MANGEVQQEQELQKDHFDTAGIEQANLDIKKILQDGKITGDERAELANMFDTWQSEVADIQSQKYREKQQLVLSLMQVRNAVAQGVGDPKLVNLIDTRLANVGALTDAPNTTLVQTDTESGIPVVATAEGPATKTDIPTQEEKKSSWFSKFFRSEAKADEIPQSGPTQNEEDAAKGEEPVEKTEEIIAEVNLTEKQLKDAKQFNKMAYTPAEMKLIQIVVGAEYDGDAGNNTTLKIAEFQAANGLSPVDGKAGPLTLGKMIGNEFNNYTIIDIGDGKGKIIQMNEKSVDFANETTAEVLDRIPQS